MRLNLKTFIPLVIIFALQISIIVPIYQVEAYLEECLQSLLDQTYKNLDIVLIDDGNIDKSLYSYALCAPSFLIKTMCPSTTINMGAQSIKDASLYRYKAFQTPNSASTTALIPGALALLALALYLESPLSPWLILVWILDSQESFLP